MSDVSFHSSCARAAPSRCAEDLALAQSLRVWKPVGRLPLIFVLVGVAAVAAAMRRSDPLPDCVITIDPGVQLNLERPADRQHLSDELAQIDAIASRFRERIRADPPVTATAHALRTHATRPDRAYRYCQAILREQVAKAHGIDLNQR